MSRTTTAILLSTAVLVMTVGTYFMVFPRVRQINIDEAGNGLLEAGRLLKEMDAADMGRLVWKMTELADRSSLRNLINDRPTQKSEIEGWLNKLRAEVAGLTTAARETAPVEDFFILDEKGLGLVRNIDLHWTGKAPPGDAKISAAINGVLQGKRTALVVGQDKKLLRAVLVPVAVSGSVQAVLLATFPLDDALVKSRSGELPAGINFAYLVADGVAASAVSANAATCLEGAIGKEAQAALKEGKSIGPKITNCAAKTWLAVGVPVAVEGSEGLYTIFVAREMDSLDKPFGEMSLLLFGLGAICLVVMLVIAVVLGGRLSTGLKQLELDAMAIAHGELQHKFELKGPAAVRAIADLLNQVRDKDTGEASLGDMLKEDPAGLREEDELQGSLDDDEEGLESTAELSPSGTLDEEDRQPEEAREEADIEDKETVSEQEDDLEKTDEIERQERQEETGVDDTAAEPQEDQEEQEEKEEQEEQQETTEEGSADDDYYRGIYTEFIKAKENLGEKIEKLNFERFVRKLKRQEEILMSKHECRAVRFKVAMKNKQVSLRPQIIK